VPGGTISTPGSESKGNPIPPATRSSEIDQGYVIVVPPAEGTEVPPRRPCKTMLGLGGADIRFPEIPLRDPAKRLSKQMQIVRQAGRICAGFTL